MRNNTLLNVRNMLKAETGESLSSANTQRDKELNYLIDSKQKWLSSEREWSFLERKVDVAMVAGTRYYTLPTTINYDRPVLVEVLYNTRWLTVGYGIGQPEYNAWNSALSVGTDPVQKWNFYNPSTTATQFEAWPIPVTTTTVRFTGQAVMTVLGTSGTWSDSATLDLDDVLVMLFCSVDVLARKNQKDAEVKHTLAKERLAYLTGNLSKRSNIVTMGGAGQGQNLVKPTQIVLVH